MNLWLRLFACLTLTGLALAAVVTAQDKDKVDKKDAKKSDKKTDKDDDKKGAKKSDKDDGKDDKVEEKLVYGQIINGKIKRFASEGAREVVVEIYLPDPMKIFNFNRWQAEQQRAIATSDPRDPGARARRIYQYQIELSKKKANPLETMSPKDVEVRANDGMRVRSLYPPLEYDDKGELKRWTAKELAALRGKTKLPGYPSDFETLRPGHFVQVYLAKMEAPKGPIAKKKLDDDVELGAAKPEAVMIVIQGEPTGK